jgi:Bacterial surface proteins containing Ig-like domains
MKKYSTLVMALCLMCTACEKDPVEVTHICLNQNLLTLHEGAKGKIGVVDIMPANAQDKRFKWSSSDTTIATINERGEIIALFEGSVKLTATATNGINAECVLTVTHVPVDELETNTKVLYLGLGESESLTATITPEYIGHKPITWSSQDPEVATVDAQGCVTGLKTGITIITAKVEDFETHCKVMVNERNGDIEEEEEEEEGEGDSM